MNTHSEERLQEVHPELSRRVHQLASMLSFEMEVVQGLRTWAQQATLYAQGRTAPGPIVTNAKPDQTAHVFGYAVDVAPFENAVPDWNASDPLWQEILAKAPSCGLAEGAQWRTFPDKPHLYLQELPATPDEEMLYTLREGGLAAVFELISSRITPAPEAT